MTRLETGGLTIDNTLSDTSTNPVQNKVIKEVIDNKADKTVATTETDGLMSAEDKGKLDAFEITTTGGKLHDKDIATTDLIPTSFAQNAVLSTIEQVNDPNLESGIYSAENVSMSFSSGVESSWFMMVVNKHRTTAGYGTQIAIPYDSGFQRGTFYRICRAGNWGNWIRIADESIITNENLLLNPDFRVNQQGKSVYTGTTECWDKWTINAGWETARSNDDLAAIFTCVTPQVNFWVVSQNIPNYKDYRGKTVTFSANIVTASTKFSLLINDGVNQLVTPVTTGRYSVTYTVSDNATELWCVICTDGQESKNEQIAVLSTKLELGTIATTFVPPNPSIEIAKVRAANNYKPYVTGEIAFVNESDSGYSNYPVKTNHGFMPSIVLYWALSADCGETMYNVNRARSFDETSFTPVTMRISPKPMTGPSSPPSFKYGYIIFK